MFCPQFILIYHINSISVCNDDSINVLLEESPFHFFSQWMKEIPFVYPMYFAKFNSSDNRLIWLRNTSILNNHDLFFN